MGKKYFFAFVMLTVLAGCSTGNTSETLPENNLENTAWSYGDAEMELWGNDFPQCKSVETSTQSPIDIHYDSSLSSHSPEGDLISNYEISDFSINRNKDEFVFDSLFPEKNFIYIEGVRFYLQSFHMHTPSEHAINGERADMEIHLVHKNDKGDLAVLGVLAKIGEGNPALATIDKVLQDNSEVKGEALLEGFNLLDLPPEDLEIARYQGSLTTPPCSEGVLWSVYLSPITVSFEQLQVFNHEKNSRKLQDLNGREVSYSKMYLG